MQAHPTTSRSTGLAALLAATALFGCSDGGGDSGGIAFQTQNTAFVVTPGALVRVVERWALFQADEFTHGPGGANFNAANGDMDMIDSIAAVVDMVAKTQTNLRVAVDDMAILGSGTGARLFFVVDEAKDTRDWGGNVGMTDVVLLTCPASGASNGALTYVATLGGSSSTRILKTNGRLYFVEDPSVPAPLAVGETAINYVTNAQPTSPVRVEHLDVAQLEAMQEPELVAVDGGLVFFTLDENVESATIGGAAGLDLNGDVDTTDPHVLGLFDGTDAGAFARVTARAVASDSGPVRALSNQAGTDWTVAFLVNEDAQGMVSLNNGDPLNLSPDLPPGWLPPQCGMNYDTDALDDVLAYLSFDAWMANPLAAPPVNTGLAGSDRVVALRTGGKHFVGTISAEADAECNLNGDTDTHPGDDEVFRWAPVGAGTPYFVDVGGLIAIEDVPGNTDGVTDLDGRFLAVVSESADERDWDGKPLEDHDLVMWINPNAATPVWDRDHSASAGIQPAGTDWMAERPGRGRVLMTFTEETIGASINGGGDGDALDSAPAFALFDPPGDLDFPGPPIAVDAGNAGTVMAAGIGFYRVDEQADNRDWNGDGLANDFVLFRTTVATQQDSNLIAVLNAAQRPSVETDGSAGVMFFTDETMVNADINADGKVGGLTPRWFRLP